MFKFNQNSLYHPLDQFEIYIISMEGLNEWSWMLLSFITNVTTVTNVTLIFFSTTWFIRQLLYNKKYSTNVSQNPVSFLVLAAYAIVRNIIKSNLILKRSQYFQTLFFLFIFIIIGNLVGLIPYSFTITSSFLVTFYIALSHFIGINLIGFLKHKWKLSNLLLPSGVPLIIAPFLIAIELISYLAKILSLSIRLFANMMSGHALLKILIGFSWGLLTSGSIYTIGAMCVWGVTIIIILIETLISFLQAAVFTILITIYINDVLVIH